MAITSSDWNDVRIQFERLTRHVEWAVLHFDDIALLDLAATLRVWCDMKRRVQSLMEEAIPPIRLPQHDVPRKLKDLLARTEYIYVPLASGVDGTAIAAKGLLYAPFSTLPDAAVTSLSRLKPPAPTGSTSSFIHWLGSAVVFRRHRGTAGVLESVTISREMLIRRIANTMGGSHPHSTMADDGGTNRFDEHIAQIKTILIADGPSLAHWQLIEIGQDIVRTFTPFFGHRPATEFRAGDDVRALRARVMSTPSPPTTEQD